MKPSIPIIEHEPLARHTSWRVGGPARYYAEVTNLADLQGLLAWAEGEGLPVLVLGSGTNMLVRDTGFAGLVLRYRAMGWQIEERDADTALLQVDAGAPMAGTARRVAAQGWGGLVWAEGLPGTIGGAVFGNAGCYGGDIASILEQATLLVNNNIENWPVESLHYGYRTSALKHAKLKTQNSELTTSPIVLAASLRLFKDDPVRLAAQMAAIATERKGKTPWGSSCGSVFKNPPGSSAGRLIDQAGLKGTRIGGAEISPRHGNYIVNLEGATSADILGLIDLARTTVQQQFGIELELEVQIV
jgi:UDP-N-acetylmuramate dehydrogenase